MTSRNEVESPISTLPEPLVSIVIPYIKMDNYLDLAVRSALEQSWSNLEVILIGDGATDDTRYYGDDRVRVVVLPRRLGTPVALNFGLSLVAGEYVARLDADDIAKPHRIRAQMEVIVANPNLVAVASAAHLIDESGSVIGTLGRGLSADSVNSIILKRNPVIHSSVLYRRASIVSMGGYNDACKRMQDYELMLRIVASGGTIEILAEPLVEYRLHGSQSSRSSPPFGRGVRAIKRARLDAAAMLGVSRYSALSAHTAWLGAQALRHSGLRRPAYLRSIGRR